MKKRFKSIQILLVVVMSLTTLVLPAYLCSTNFFGTKIASSSLFFENPDQEKGLPDRDKDEIKIFGPAAFFSILLPAANLSEQSSRSFFRALPLRQRTPVLRC